MFTDTIDIDPDQYIKPKPEREARRGNDKQFLEFQWTSSPFIESFFPESVRLWNTLPQQIIGAASSQTFKNSVQGLDLPPLLRPNN